MKTITAIIKKSNSPFAQLLNKLRVSRDLELVFRTALDANLAKHCHFANYKNSELTVTVANTSWATRLRYIIPDIIKNLRVQPEFKEITSIRYLVTPPSVTPKTKSKQIKRSRSNENLWHKTIMDLKHKIISRGKTE